MITESYNVNAAFDATYSQGENPMKARQLISRPIWRIARVVVIVAALLSTTSPVGKAGALDPALDSGSDMRLGPNRELSMIWSAQLTEGISAIERRSFRARTASVVMSSLNWIFMPTSRPLVLSRAGRSSLRRRN